MRCAAVRCLARSSRRRGLPPPSTADCRRREGYWRRQVCCRCSVATAMHLITFYQRPFTHPLFACHLQPIGFCVTSNAILQPPPHVSEDAEAHVARRVGSVGRSGRCAGQGVVGASCITRMSSTRSRTECHTFSLFSHGFCTGSASRTTQTSLVGRVVRWQRERMTKVVDAAAAAALGMMPKLIFLPLMRWQVRSQERGDSCCEPIA